MVTLEQQKFIDTVAEAARIAGGELEIPASVTIAQAILESGWGRTELAQKYLNFFGIKAAHGAEVYCEFPTKEYIDGVVHVVQAHFAWYKTALDSFRAHAWLLTNSPRYRPALEARGDWAEFARRLGPFDKEHNPHGCGYSTNPLYGRRIAEIVTQFNLTRYDQGVAVNG